VLKDAGLLQDATGRDYYQLQPEALEGLRSWLAKLRNACLLPPPLP